jgi:hypothetical protein
MSERAAAELRPAQHALDEEARLRRLLLCVGGAALLLMAVTWRLWWSSTPFPKVPLVELPQGWPNTVDAIAASVMWLGGTALIVGNVSEKASKLRRWGWLLPIGWLAATVLNQHRLQPWAYQFAAIATVGQLARPALAVRLLRLLAVGVYFWSALSKLDFQFAHTVGSQLFEQLLKFFGYPPGQFAHRDVAAAALLLPAGELCLVPLLCWHRSRRLGVAAATAMHAALVLLLGPLGLDHAPGVLLWNLYFIVQAWILFWPSTSHGAVAGSTAFAAVGHAPARGRRGGEGWAIGLIGLILLLPLGERRGWFDHWPSWALYAPHSSRVAMRIPAARVDSLPPSLAVLVERENASPWQWVVVPLDAWSLEVLRVPIYPQARFQLGVARAVAQRSDLERDVVVELRGPANRTDGRRRSRQLNGIDALRQATGRFFLNAQPRL